TGVVLTDGTTLEARRAVLLCAGAIATPAILMRSGLGPGALLKRLGVGVRHDLSQIGQNLQDHLLSGGNVYRAAQEVPMTTTQHSEAMMYLRAKGAEADAPPDLVVGVTSVPLVSA